MDVTNIGSVQIRNVATIGGNIINAVPSRRRYPPNHFVAQVRLRGPGGTIHSSNISL
jgi:CO/xanthine dehydrogenase FAD-binding subunit